MSDKLDYWFPAKTRGWGFGLPVAWQGWVVVGLYAAAVTALFLRYPPETQATPFYLGVLAATAALVLTVWFKGERR